MATIATTFANAILIDGISIFIVRERELETGHINAIFLIQVILAVSLSLAIAAAGPIFSYLYAEPELARIMLVMAVLPLLYSLSSVPSALLQRSMAFRALMVRSFVGAGVGGGVGVALAVSGYGVWSLVLMAVAQWLAQCVCLWGATDWRPGFQFMRRQRREVVGFGLSAVAVNLLQILNLQILRFVIAASLGAVPLGFFTMAFRITEVISLLTLVPISQVMIPTLAGMQGDIARLRAGLTSVVELSLAIALPCFTGLFVIAPDLVPVIFGHGWGEASIIVQIVSISGLLWALYSSFDALIIAAGLMTLRMRISAASVALLAAALGVTHHFGLVAVVVTLVARDLILCGVYMMFLHRRRFVDWPPMLRRIAPLVGATAIMAGLVLLWRLTAGVLLPEFASLISEVCLGFVVYAVGIAIFARGRSFALLTAILAIRSQNASITVQKRSGTHS
jgi:O-antigen/teichoic acid export membrane protein